MSKNDKKDGKKSDKPAPLQGASTLSQVSLTPLRPLPGAS
jgi:hypothetical protein